MQIDIRRVVRSVEISCTKQEGKDSHHRTDTCVPNALGVWASILFLHNKSERDTVEHEDYTNEE